jgi:5-methylthioadenosine/S-adenosylhomocysteine deaminase
MPVNDPVAAVVYGMDTSNVDSVYVGGPARKQAGQLVGADPVRIAEQAITSRACLASKVANGCLRACARRASLGGGRCR